MTHSTSPSSIPAEAVEAAAANYWDNNYSASTGPQWIDAVATPEHDDETAQVRDMMRAALEAAAPHIAAQALEDAADYLDGVKVKGQAVASSKWLRNRAAVLRPTP